MENRGIWVILAVMVILTIFVKVVSMQIDLVSERITSTEERIITLERKEHIYGIE